MLQDLTYGLRMMRRAAPLYAGVVLTLIVGLGVNSIVFSIFNGLLFRAPVSRDPSSFVQIYASLSGQWHRELHGPPSLATLEEFEAAIDSRLSAKPETIAATIGRDAERYSAVVTMTAVPAGLALFLSVIGRYGLTAFAAAQRTHEIGVRVAVGARPGQVIALFFGALRRPFAVGALAGSVLAAIGVTLVARANLMPTVSARDPLAYAVAIAVVLCTAAAATLIPAFRAARQDPWSALGTR